MDGERVIYSLDRCPGRTTSRILDDDGLSCLERVPLVAEREVDISVPES